MRDCIVIYLIYYNFFFNFRSIARADLDISYITSRVIVMSYPSELLESAYKTNHIEDVRVSVSVEYSILLSITSK